jgi:hypothetical protein
MYLMVSLEESGMTREYYYYLNNDIQKLIDDMYFEWITYGDCYMSLYWTDMTEAPEPTKELIDDPSMGELHELTEVDWLIEELGKIGLGMVYPRGIINDPTVKRQADAIWDEFRVIMDCYK